MSVSFSFFFVVCGVFFCASCCYDDCSVLVESYVNVTEVLKI